MEIKIKCSFKKMVPINELKPHPKNRNKHPDDQIDRLAKIIEYQGIRHPIKVSTRSGFITSGHGRLLVYKKLKLKEVPVDYQDYDSDEQEYADVQSDNAIAQWSELDLSSINIDLPDLGPDFDIDFLGLKNFNLDFKPGDIDDQGKLDEKKFVFMECPHCLEKFEKGQARVIED